MINGCHEYFNFEKNLKNFYLNRFKNRIVENSVCHLSRHKSSDKIEENKCNNLFNKNDKDTINKIISRNRSELFSPRNNKNKDNDSSVLVISDIDVNDVVNQTPLLNNRLSKFKKMNIDNKISIPKIKSSKDIRHNSKLKSSKRVTFKKIFVNIVKIESYKEYNALILQDDYYDKQNKAFVNCTCVTF